MKRLFPLVMLLTGAATVQAQTNNQNLAALQSALSVYYGDTEGLYPTDLAMLVPRYISAIPAAQCDTGSSNRVTNFPAATPDQSGGWGYVNAPSSTQWGTLFLNCESTSDPIKPTPAENQAKLNSVRSALAVYYGDTEGEYPPSLQTLVPRYISQIPPVVCHGQVSSEIQDFASPTPNDEGGWGYVSLAISPNWGEVFLNCNAERQSPMHRPSPKHRSKRHPR